MNKVTKIIIQFPKGQEPNFVVPENYQTHRFLLGKLGKNPLVAICMNPSAANNDTSDRTVNRIINASIILDYNGRIIANVYPERATKAIDLESFNEDLCTENINILEKFLVQNNIKEVFGARGDLKFNPLQKWKNKVLEMLKKK